jgi:H+/Cl- antiporter ClcA
MEKSWFLFIPGGGADFIPDFVVLLWPHCLRPSFKAPVTGSILITEMTGSFEHLLPVIIVSMVSYIISDIFKIRSVYEDLYQLTVTSQKTAD